MPGLEGETGTLGRVEAEAGPRSPWWKWSLLVAGLLSAVWTMAALPVAYEMKEWNDCAVLGGRPAGTAWFPVPKAYCDLPNGERIQIEGFGRVYVNGEQLDREMRRSRMGK